ncbi:MAG: hypothetical protein ACI4QV_00910, partial [Acutalibacteraceae bacterium]
MGKTKRIIRKGLAAVLSLLIAFSAMSIIPIVSAAAQSYEEFTGTVISNCEQSDAEWDITNVNSSNVSYDGTLKTQGDTGVKITVEAGDDTTDNTQAILRNISIPVNHSTAVVRFYLYISDISQIDLSSSCFELLQSESSEGYQWSLEEIDAVSPLANGWNSVCLSAADVCSEDITVTELRLSVSGKSGNTGASAAIDNIVIQDILADSTYSENNANIVYAGEWSSKSGESFADGAAYATSSAGSAVGFSFIGTEFEFITAAGPSEGVVTVSVDGEDIETVDLSAAAENQTYRFASKRFTGFVCGSHDVVITFKSGAEFYFDGLTVKGRITESQNFGSVQLSAAETDALTENKYEAENNELIVLS